MISQHFIHTLVRKGLALLQFYRILQIIIAYFVYNGYRMGVEEVLYATISIFLLILFFFNIRVFWSGILLSWCIVSFDVVFFSANYSTVIFRMLCLYFALNDWIVNSRTNSETKQRESAILVFLLMLVFGVQNVLSASVHLSHAYWNRGDAMGIIYTHAYFSRFYEFFRYWVVQDFQSFTMFSKVTNWIMVILQLLLVPLYLIPRLRIVAAIWVAALVVWMFLLLGVSFFSWFTFAFWLIVFARPANQNPGIYFNLKRMRKPFRRVYLFVVVLSVFLLSVKLPGVHRVTDNVFWFIREWDTKLFLTKKVAWIGLFEPDVFNVNHLEGGQKWLRIYRLKNGKREEVPFWGPDGEKQNYFRFDPLLLKNHGSDFLMYGNVASYVISIDTFTYQNSTLPDKMKGRVFERLVRFDNYWQNGGTAADYEVEYWERTHKTQDGNVSFNFDKKMVQKRRFRIAADSLVWKP